MRPYEPSNLIHGDCLKEMDTHIGEGTVSLILTDLPYSKTALGWDEIIPAEELWPQVQRVLKSGGWFITTSSQPFTTYLINSNLSWFKYCLVWDKGRGTNPLTAEIMPQISHEDIILFRRPGSPFTYNPQMWRSSPYKNHGGTYSSRTLGKAGKKDYDKKDNQAGSRYPLSILQFSINIGTKDHPTEKPVSLMEYLVRTYSNEGDIVLDICMGSGTTGVACLNSFRPFIGIELDPDYYQIAKTRMAEARAQIRMF